MPAFSSNMSRETSAEEVVSLGVNRVIFRYFASSPWDHFRRPNRDWSDMPGVDGSESREISARVVCLAPWAQRPALKPSWFTLQQGGQLAKGEELVGAQKSDDRAHALGLQTAVPPGRLGDRQELRIFFGVRIGGFLFLISGPVVLISGPLRLMTGVRRIVSGVSSFCVRTDNRSSQ